MCVLRRALRCEWSREQALPEGPVRVSGTRRRAQEEEIGAERAPWPELRWGPPDSTEHVFQKKKREITEAICKETLKETDFKLYFSCVFAYAVPQWKLVEFSHE